VVYINMRLLVFIVIRFYKVISCVTNVIDTVKTMSRLWHFDFNYDFHKTSSLKKNIYGILIAARFQLFPECKYYAKSFIL